MKKDEAFYQAGAKTKQLHVLISEEDRAKLAKLSRQMKMTASEVVRRLIHMAKLKED
jgi:macrodomain Ter protein organizer (MatP/YcbG family)